MGMQFEYLLIMFHSIINEPMTKGHYSKEKLSLERF